jgi:hypothetical protein
VQRARTRAERERARPARVPARGRERARVQEHARERWRAAGAGEERGARRRATREREGVEECHGRRAVCGAVSREGATRRYRTEARKQVAAARVPCELRRARFRVRLRCVRADEREHVRGAQALVRDECRPVRIGQPIEGLAPDSLARSVRTVH